MLAFILRPPARLRQRVGSSSPQCAPATCQPTKRIRARRYSPRCSANPPPKPGYYKNPSRAIEKGGGFYVPGLQGPRLRVFVPALASVFLVANHMSSGASATAVSISEGIAVLAAVSLLVTAISDLQKEKVLPVIKTEATSLKSSNAVTDVTSEQTSSQRSAGTTWAAAVATDLTTASAIACFRGNKLIFSSGEVNETSPGVVVERVRKEKRELYISNSSTLPEEITLPFLNDGSWTVFLTPTTRGDVVVFASKEELSRDNRRWLELVAERFGD